MFVKAAEVLFDLEEAWLEMMEFSSQTPPYHIRKLKAKMIAVLRANGFDIPHDMYPPIARANLT